MINILLSVDGTKLAITNYADLTSAQANITSCVFSFSSVWDGFTKTVIFYSDPVTKVPVVIKPGENSCNIPWETLKTDGILYIGILGILGDQILTTNYVTHVITEGAGHGDVPAPTEDIYLQIIGIMQTQKVDAATATAQAIIATNKAVESKASADDALLSEAYAENSKIDAEAARAAADVSKAAAKLSETNAETSAQAAAEQAGISTNKANEVKDLITKTPYVGEDGHWYEWNTDNNDYSDTGIVAHGDKGDTFTYADMSPENKVDLLNIGGGQWEQEFADKYAGLEAEYAPRLTGVESSLAQIDTQKAKQTDLDTEIANRTNAIATEKNERLTEIAVERARINSFTVLTAGSTTGDAELIDSRIGADGDVYTNAGSATRGQFTDINSKLRYLKIGYEPVNANFVIGTVEGDQGTVPKVIKTVKYRVCASTSLSYDRDVTLTADYGYRFFAYILDGAGKRINNTGWKTSYTFTAGTVIWVTIGRVAENTSEIITNKYEFIYAVKTTTIIENRFSDIENNVSDIESNISDIMGKDYIPITSYVGYYNSDGEIVNSTEMAEKYTDKIKCFSGMKIKVNLKYTTAIHQLWIAVCEWKTDGTFLRTSIVNTDAQSYSFMYEPSSSVEYVSFTYRSFNDETFGLNYNTSTFLIHINAKTYTDEKINELSHGLRSVYDFDTHKLKGINHRGYNSIAPENTISAYKLSKQKGFDFVEADIKLTSDGIPILLHDLTIDRTSNGSGNVLDFTFAELRELDFGSWKSTEFAGERIPSFEEFIIFCRNAKLYPYIELTSTVAYSANNIQNMLNIVDKYRMTRSCTWISFSSSYLKTIVTLEPSARVGLLLENDCTSTDVTSIMNAKTDTNEVFINAHVTTITDSGIALCEAENIPVELWTVSKAGMLLLNSYISGCTSDSDNFEDVIFDKAING